MPGIVQDSVISSEQNSPDSFGKQSIMQKKTEVDSFESADESLQSFSDLKQEEGFPNENANKNGTTNEEADKPGIILWLDTGGCLKLSHLLAVTLTFNFLKRFSKHNTYVISFRSSIETIGLESGNQWIE